MPYYGKRRFSKRSLRGRRYGRRRFAGFRAKKPTSVSRATYLQRLSARPRRVYKTRGQWRRTGGRIRRPISGFPAAQFVKLRYQVWVKPLTVSGDGWVVNFRGNSSYDPEYATGGGQPRWYDQYAARYSRVLCHGSSITCTHSSLNSAGEAGPYLWGVHAATSTEVKSTQHITSINAATAGELRQRRFTKSKLCDIQTGLPHTATGGQRNFWIKSFATTKQVNGLQYDRFSAIADTGGVVSSDHEWLWQVFGVQPLAGQDFTNLIYVRVDLTYYCTFFERKVTWDV